MKRDIIRIDEEKCDGCGRCVTTCAEGAIQLVDGKARLVNDAYCDGLGACLGECPRGALTIEKREAGSYDEKAVRGHVKTTHHRKIARISHHEVQGPVGAFSCPGSRSQLFSEGGSALASEKSQQTSATPSELRQWPVQLHLAPVEAPYFERADLLIAADCVPFAYADFHRRFLRRRTLLVGCPKLDDVESYQRKLIEILRRNDIRLLEVVHMEVPCCFGLEHLIRSALRESGKSIPLILTTVSVRGEILKAGRFVPEDEHKYGSDEAW